jgi:hypothetical protein
MKNFPTNAPGRPIVIVLIFICIIAGCASANRGSLRNSQEVGRAFETFHVYPNHRYWYYNQENNPYAVVGLQDPYTIEDINWKEVDPNSKTFEQIGMWYSSLNAGIKVDPETKTVFITAAMPWVDDDGRYGSGVGVGIGTGGSGIGIRIGF